MPGTWSAVASRAAVLALAVAASGCLAGTGAPHAAAGGADAVADCDEVVAGIRQTSTTTLTGVGEAGDRDGEDEDEGPPESYDAFDGVMTWTAEDAFCHALANGPSCGFELNAWAEHHGFRLPGDPLRRHRSIDTLEFGEPDRSPRFSLSRGGMGVFVFADAFVPTLGGSPERGQRDDSAALREFLRNVTTAPEGTIERWASMVEGSGHANLWEDPAWPGWAEYSSTDHPPWSGEPPGEPPASLFRVAEVYTNVSGGRTAPLEHDPMREARETWGPWTFRFSIDQVEAVRNGTGAMEVLLVNAADHVRYYRIGEENLDDAGARNAASAIVRCLGLPEPDFEGAEVVHGGWPPRDGDDEDASVPLPQFSVSKDEGQRTLTVLEADEGWTWGDLEVTGCAQPDPADALSKGDVLSECAGEVSLAHRGTGRLLFQATFA